jgi:hypothetical protein
MVVGAMLLCNDGRRPNFIFYFLFFYLTVSREKKRVRKREKRQSFEPCFPALLVGITQAPSYNVNSLQQQQHQHASAATTPVALATLATLEVVMII